VDIISLPQQSVQVYDVTEVLELHKTSPDTSLLSPHRIAPFTGNIEPCAPRINVPFLLPDELTTGLGLLNRATTGHRELPDFPSSVPTAWMPLTENHP
jgi:hypothetical protein